MNTKVNLSSNMRKLLRCPVCHAELKWSEDILKCTNSGCGIPFPIINNIPVLLNESNSLFSINDFVQLRNTTFNLKESKEKKALKKIIPKISANVKTKENFKKFLKALSQQSDSPKLLVIGGSILGQGMEGLIAASSIELIESDVTFGPRTKLIFDAHDIPFEKVSFNGVVVQAVLEHVVDPYRCVEEIYRVLKPEGLVYAETPFMQQVHMRQYDFTRFTHLGHRRLFRNFEEIDSGVAVGPGTALAWSYKYFLLCFTNIKILRKAILVFSHFTSFYLKYIDKYLINSPGAFDAASGYYFVGKKSNRILSDRELIKLYRGGL